MKKLALIALLVLAGCAKEKPATTAPVAAASPARTPAMKATPAPTPAEPELAFPEGDAFRKTQPAPGPTPNFVPPKVATFTVGDGITAYLVESHDLPTVGMTLAFDGGSVDDPAGKEGTAALCMSLMNEGTQKLDRLAFDEALADLASSVGAGAGRDQQFVSMTTLRKNLDPTMGLWADTILTPRLDGEELARDVKTTLDGLRSLKGNAAGIAQRLTVRTVLGDAHPYGRIETEASVQGVTVAECKKHIADYVKPEGAKLFVVGDITQAEVKTKVSALLGKWKGKPKPMAKIGEPKPPAGRVFFVDVPSAPQSVIRVMEPGPERKAPDFFPTSLLGSVLGGGFASRINMNIREAHGYAYGASAGFQHFRKGGLFIAAASVKREVTAESLHEILGEIKRIREAEVSDAELAREKEGAVLSLPADFATSSAVLSTYQSLVYFGLPLDWYASYVPKVQAVTKKAALDAAVKHIDPDGLKILIVGDAETVLPKIEEMLKSGELGKGDLVRLDADGKPVK